MVGILFLYIVLLLKKRYGWYGILQYHSLIYPLPHRVQVEDWDQLSGNDFMGKVQIMLNKFQVCEKKQN